MDLWRVIVFAIVKQCLNLDVDLLLHLANRDSLLRELSGHGNRGFDPSQYSRQRLADNVQLLTPELIEKVNHLTVQAGYEVSGKKYGAALRGRCGSMVAKTHVHFPTDVVGCCSVSDTRVCKGGCGLRDSCLAQACGSHEEGIQGVPAGADGTALLAESKRHEGVLAAVQKECNERPGALACHVRYGRNGGGAGRDRAVSAEVLADQIRRRILGVRRVRMRRRCFPLTSRIRGGSAKARRGCCLSWAFRSRCDHQFILAHQIMWEVNGPRCSNADHRRSAGGLSGVQRVQF